MRVLLLVLSTYHNIIYHITVNVVEYMIRQQARVKSDLYPINIQVDHCNIGKRATKNGQYRPKEQPQQTFRTFQFIKENL